MPVLCPKKGLLGRMVHSLRLLGVKWVYIHTLNQPKHKVYLCKHHINSLPKFELVKEKRNGEDEEAGLDGGKQLGILGTAESLFPRTEAEILRHPNSVPTSQHQMNAHLRISLALFSLS